MLQNLRDRLTGPFVWFIVGIIVIPFAFFGIETLRGGGGDPTVVRVGDQKITQSQFRAGYDQRMRQLQALMGENFRADMIDPVRFRQTVLDDMVQESLMRQHVQKAGYRAGDAAVFSALSSIPAFQEDGKFSGELYRSRLAQQGFNPARFEAQLRDGIQTDQLREGLLDSAFVAQAAAAQAYRLEQQQRWLAYAVFEAARYRDQATVDAAQVQERYDSQMARYQAPERLKVAYLELALDTLPPAPAPEADYLRAIYEADKATRFTTVEERRARHILVNFGADKDKARAKAQSLAARIAKGADFAALAGAESDDPGSKNKGGDLGWVRRGQMVEKFEQALFALKPGEVSEPVETEFGWHLVRLDELREARTRAFEEPGVQAELLALYRDRDSTRRFQDMAEKLETLAFESPGSLEPAARALGLELRTSEWFTRDAGTGIAEQPAVREAAFADEVLGAGENSRPIDLGGSRVVVIRKEAHEPPRQKPLEEVRDTIVRELKEEAGRARAAAEAKAALDALAGGQALEQVITARRVELKAPGLVRRDAPGVDARIIETLFRMPRPAEGAAQREQVVLPNGDVAVLVSTAVRDADWAAASDAERATWTGRLRESVAGAEFSAYRADLQKRLSVQVVNPPDAGVDPAS
jgi:peptidyl-prolyl cis-trans isomerase D